MNHSLLDLDYLAKIAIKSSKQPEHPSMEIRLETTQSAIHSSKTKQNLANHAVPNTN